MIKKILLLFLFWRILLFTPIITAHFLLSPRAGFDYTQLPYFLEKGSVLNNFLLYPFANFDGVYYLIIAANGYTVNAGFFPLFPLLISIVSKFFELNIFQFDPGEYVIATFLVNILFLLSLFIFYKLIRLDFSSNTAISSVFFMLIFPTSFFFASIYSESLFLFLSLLSFYFARKNKWLASGIAGALSSATRFVGISIWPALIYEYFVNEKKKSLRKLLSICLAPIGLIFYMIFNFYKWGNPFYFIAAQGNFANNRSVSSVILFPQTLYRYIKILITLKPVIYEWWVALFELSFFIFALVLFYIAWKKRIRMSYLIFGILCFLIPVSSGTFTALPRYILPIFPLFITLALIKNKAFKIIYCAISVILLFLFFALFSRGYYIS